MRTILLRSSLLLAALVSACGSSDDPGTNGTGSGLVADCQKVCAATAPLKCPKAEPDCMASCQNATDVPPKCKAQFEALMHCSAMHPTADWECDMDGVASLKNGCDAEALAIVACIFSMP
jgi:hypothetical protein